MPEVQRMRRVLQTVRRVDAANYDTLLAAVEGVSGSTIRRYCSGERELRRLIEKRDGPYTVTELGRDALAIDWEGALGAMGQPSGSR